MSATSRQYHLVSRPGGMPEPGNFNLELVPLAAPEPGQIMVRNTWLSVDPYMRGRMNDRPSYIPPFELNRPMDGAAIGVVEESADDRFERGDTVSHFAGWRDRAVIDADSASPVDSTIPPQAYLGPLGVPGLAAYAGLLRIGAPKAGETVFVSAAAGTVGSLVAQIAKLKGCRVIGSAGSEDKIRWLREVAGADAVINYRTAPDMTAALAEAAPEGIDIYFDNVGGDHLEAAIANAKDFARFPICGMISQYNKSPEGPRNIFGLVEKRILMQGLIVMDEFGMMPDLQSDMTGWIADGRITWQETVREGLESAPDAFLELFSGGNSGKMLVRLPDA